VEKSLKSVLVHCGVSFPSTHDLNVLMLLLPEGLGELPYALELPELGIYSTQRRYEEAPTPATHEDTNEAEKIAACALAWAKGICN
jgi:HEPN domain-containing protein